jgi:hypothetical protein
VNNVIGSAKGIIDPLPELAAVHIQVKEIRGRAWIYLPGMP